MCQLHLDHHVDVSSNHISRFWDNTYINRTLCVQLIEWRLSFLLRVHIDTSNESRIMLFQTHHTTTINTNRQNGLYDYSQTFVLEHILPAPLLIPVLQYSPTLPTLTYCYLPGSFSLHQNKYSLLKLQLRRQLRTMQAPPHHGTMALLNHCLYSNCEGVC